VDQQTRRGVPSPPALRQLDRCLGRMRSSTANKERLVRRIGGAARAALVLQHAADGQAVRWPVGRAAVTTDARPTAQRASFKGPAAMALAAAVWSVFEGGAYR